MIKKNTEFWEKFYCQLQNKYKIITLFFVGRKYVDSRYIYLKVLNFSWQQQNKNFLWLKRVLRHVFRCILLFCIQLHQCCFFSCLGYVDRNVSCPPLFILDCYTQSRTFFGLSSEYFYHSYWPTASELMQLLARLTFILVWKSPGVTFSYQAYCNIDNC